MNIQQYQSQILGPTQVIDYASIIMGAYPMNAVQVEPFIGFKVLCRDSNAFTMNPGDRIRQIEANLGFLRGKGCCIRETSAAMPDGFWVISFPVPRSQVATSLSNMMEVLAILEQSFGIVRHGLFEINVSGKCGYAETEKVLTNVIIPSKYMESLVQPENTPYKLGHVTRINDNFICLRCRWRLNPLVPLTVSYEDLMVLSVLIGSIYH